MNYTEVFKLYDKQEPLAYEVKDTSHGGADYRRAVFAEWPDRKIVIKITSNDFTTPERVEGWAKTIEEYITAGYIPSFAYFCLSGGFELHQYPAG